jgi:TRAP-type C4-dicarboxylate transport system permease small subunit
MSKVLKTTSRIFEGLSLVFLLSVFFCVFVQIIMRNFFSSGSIVLEELARISLVSLVFLMIPVLSLDGQHIIVDILTARLKGSVRRISNLIVQVLCTGFSVFLLVAIAQVLQRNWNVRTSAMRMPNIILYIPIVLGLLFMGIASIHLFITIFKTKEEKK